MFLSKEDAALLKGTWRLWKAGTFPAAFFSCPLCGETGMFEPPMGFTGKTSLPFKCRRLKCTFKDTVSLVGWKS